MADLHELYQSIILDHHKNPRNYGVIAAPTHRAEGYNPLCGDKVELFLCVNNERIESIQFEAACCAICKASASMMTELLEGKTISESAILLQRVDERLDSSVPEKEVTSIYSDSSPCDLDALLGVRAFKSRIRCAELPWRTYESALESPM